VFQPNESAVAIFSIQVRPIARQDVCVDVDLHLNVMRNN
jgi:hypothetical protein